MNPNRPEGALNDLLPPVRIDQDIRKSRSEAQDKTLFMINSGILPHGNSERDDIAEILKLVKNPRGILDYTEGIANFHNHFSGDDRLPPLTHTQLLAQQLGFDVYKDWRDMHIKEHRNDVIMTKVDHMLNYVDDAQDKLTVMTNLRTLLEPTDNDISINNLENLDIVNMRALLDLVRFYEVQDYATSPKFQKSHMDETLLGQGIDGISDYIKEAIGDRSIGQIKLDIANYLKLEKGRLLFWIDHLVGHEAQPVEQDRLAVGPRVGLVDSTKYNLRDRIEGRLAGIARINLNMLPRQNEK